MMETVQVTPFLPIGSNTITVSATGTSSSTAITAPTNPQNPEQPGTCRIYNAGPGLAFVKFGTGTVVAAIASDMPIPAGNTEVFWVPAYTTSVGVISASTSTVYLTPGQGS